MKFGNTPKLCSDRAHTLPPTSDFPSSRSISSRLQPSWICLVPSQSQQGCPLPQPAPPSNWHAGEGLATVPNSRVFKVIINRICGSQPSSYIEIGGKECRVWGLQQTSILEFTGQLIPRCTLSYPVGGISRQLHLLSELSPLSNMSPLSGISSVALEGIVGTRGSPFLPGCGFPSLR